MTGRIRRAARAFVAAPDVKPAPAEGGPDAETRKLLGDIRWELQQQRKFMEVFRVATAAPVLDEVGAFAAEHVMGLDETLRRVIDDKVSLARFGDGELRMMLREDFSLRFQPQRPGLAADLAAVLRYDGFDPDRLLLGFPSVYRNLHYSEVWLDIWRALRPMLSTEHRYGNTHVSRPLFFQKYGQAGVDLWRTVWADQHVCVVTGAESRFELVPELFDTAKSIRFAYSKPVDAYTDLPRLMPELERDSADLFVISLGPAGTLVAAEMSRRGRWAIDVGHISDSWANVFQGAPWPESLDVRKPSVGKSAVGKSAGGKPAGGKSADSKSADTKPAH
jgi:Glycosyltransferase GT-D fold